MVIRLSRKKFLIVLVAFVFLAIAAIKFFRNEKRIVEKFFAKFANAISLDSGETAIQTGLKMNALPDFFDLNCEIEAGSEWIDGSFSSAELASKIARGRVNFKKIKVLFHDLTIDINNDSAEANFTAQLSGITKDGRTINEIREMKAYLIKKDGRWLFRKFTLVETFKR